MKTAVARALVVLWAVIAAAFPGVLGVAHALQSAATAGAVTSHVERQGGQDCSPVHDAECGLCSKLRVAATGAAPAELLPAGATRLHAPRRWDGRQVASTGARGGARPRAPPAL